MILKGSLWEKTHGPKFVSKLLEARTLRAQCILHSSPLEFIAKWHIEMLIVHHLSHIGLPEHQMLEAEAL
jgi:hypothetical protein